MRGLCQRGFPPLVLGVLRDQMGTFTPGFVLLALFALACLVLVRRILGPSGGRGERAACWPTADSSEENEMLFASVEAARVGAGLTEWARS